MESDPFCHLVLESGTLETKVEQPLQQLGIRDPGLQRSRGELFPLGYLRIGIGFETPDEAVRADSVVDACIPAQPQDPIDSLAQVGQSRLDRWKQVHRRLLFDAMAL